METEQPSLFDELDMFAGTEETETDSGNDEEEREEPLSNDELFDQLEEQIMNRHVGFSAGSQHEPESKENLLKDSALFVTGIIGIVVLLIMRFASAFIAPFAILTIGRLIYCQMTNKTFDIWWSVHGAFFAAVLFAILTLFNIASSRAEAAKGCIRKIPATMVEIGTGVFAIQFIWHGVHCFFSNDQFLILDAAWLGDLLIGVIGSVFGVVLVLLKRLFARD